MIDEEFKNITEYLDEKIIFHQAIKEPINKDLDISIKLSVAYEKLQKENQKYKEVIDKAIYYINNNGAKQYNHHDNYRGKWYSLDELDTIVDILKEVE